LSPNISERVLIHTVDITSAMPSRAACPFGLALIHISILQRRLEIPKPLVYQGYKMCILGVNEQTAIASLENL